MTGNILVTGATGGIGGLLVDRLAAGTHAFTVMCRRPEQTDAFRRRGIDAVLGDFDEPATLATAFTGHDQLFLLPPGGSGASDQYRRDVAAIDAARTADVRHVVKISAADANPDSPVPWARDHGRSDEHLRRSGLAWTVLHPTSFMTNLLGMAPLVRRGLLPNPSGHGATTWVATADIADAALAVLTDADRQGGPAAAGHDHLLTSTQPLSFPQIAVTMGETLGRTVRPLPVPAPLLYAGMRFGGSPHWQARGMVAQFHRVVRRGLDGVRVHSTDLGELIGRPPTDMARFIADHRPEFVTG